MNAAQAKQLPLTGILARLGHQPHHERNGVDIWYLSPFREESDASFKINPKQNIWYDFGEAKGGGIIEFVLHYYGLTSVSDALRQLDILVGHSPIKSPDLSATQNYDLFASSPPPSKLSDKPAKSSFELIKVQPLANRALISYLKKRGISSDLAHPYVEEIYYRRGDRQYFALCFANNSGGWELRNPYFKGSMGSKDVSTIPASGAGESVTIFEGFLDFLSFLAHEKKSAPAMPAIIMNSLAMKDRTIAAIHQINPLAVHLYLDHDTAGRNLTAAFGQELAPLTVTDKSVLYAGHKDLNDFLLAHQASILR